jgi:hypothetical protein
MNRPIVKFISRKNLKRPKNIKLRNFAPNFIQINTINSDK